MFLQAVLVLLALLAQATEQTRCRSHKHGANIVGVGMDNHLYMRRSTSKKFSWIKVPRSCCVTQIHILKNGMILGVGTGRHIWKRRTLFSSWSRVPNSCCVKDITTYQTSCGRRTYIVGVGMNGKLYSKTTLNGKWTGPYSHSGTVKAVAGVKGTIYGVGTNNNIYKRPGLHGRWRHIPRSCCVKDISVLPSRGHPTYAVGTNNRLYRTALQTSKPLRYYYQGAHTCCVKAVAVQRKSIKVKIIGVGLNNQLYVKPKLSSPWAHIARSGSVKSITTLNNGLLVGIGMNNHLYYRTNVDSYPWKHVRNSCCVKSIAQMKNGLIIGIGMGNRLWVRQSLFSKWSWMVPKSGSVTSITIGPRGQIIGVGLNKHLYVKKCLTSPWIGPLQNSGRVIDVKYGSDGYLYGVGMNKRIYKKRSKSLRSRWRIIPKYNCCVKGISVC